MGSRFTSGQNLTFESQGGFPSSLAHAAAEDVVHERWLVWMDR